MAKPDSAAATTTPAPTTPARDLLAALPPRQQAFILELLKDPTRNQGRAYERAGYRARGDSADANAARLLGTDRVRAAYDALTKELIEEEIVDAKVVLREMLTIATIDIRSFFDERGNVKPMHLLSEAQGRALAGFEVLIKNAQAGDGVTDTIHKFKLWDKVRVLEMLAKHKNLFVEKVEVDAEVTIRWES